MKKWLVIDDDIDYQKIIELILNRLGIKVDRTSDPDEAMNKIRTNGYDRILVDQRMPIMSGIELLSRMKKHLHCPVYIISAYRESDLKAEMNEKNVFVDGFISKDNLSSSLKELACAT